MPKVPNMVELAKLLLLSLVLVLALVLLHLWLFLMGKNMKNSLAIISNGGNRNFFFCLTTLNLVRFLMEDALIPIKRWSTSDRCNNAWNNSDFLCRNYALSNSLYHVYARKKRSKICGSPWNENIKLRMLVLRNLS